MRTFILLLAITCLGAACRKPISEEETAAKQRSADFLASVKQQKYKLVAFYSDKPIDYITTDSEVRSETDLWAYVTLHVIDDENYFAPDGVLTIYQKANKFPGNESEQINGSYEITARGVDVIFKFVDYIYVPTEYKLHEFDNTSFVVYTNGPSGSKLFSKFMRIQ
jgi:hypothetical protein